MPSLICQVFYVSRPAPALSATDIRDLLQISRRNNRRLDITGCLLYSGRYFAQVFEGRCDDVAALIGRIAADPRHRDVRVLREGRRAERGYGEWSMGYLHDAELAERLEALARPGACDPLDIAAVMARMRPDAVAGALR